MRTRKTSTTASRKPLIGLVLGSLIVSTGACAPAPRQPSGADEPDAPVITVSRQPAPRVTGGAVGVIIYFSPDSPAIRDEKLREKEIADAAQRAGIGVSATRTRAVDHSGELSVVVTVDGGLTTEQLSRLTKELYAGQGVVHVDPDRGSVRSGDTGQ